MIEMGQGTLVAILGGYFVAVIVSLLGVIKMWKLQKAGFYIYAVINSLGIIFAIYDGSYLVVQFYLWHLLLCMA